jgi:hypothetical protein
MGKDSLVARQDLPLVAIKVFCSYLAVSVLRTYVGMPIAKPTDRQAGGAVER